MSLPPSIGTPPPAPRRPRPSRRGPVFIGALAILAVSATVMWLSGSSDEPTAEGPTETSLTRSSSDTTTSAPTISVPPASTTTGPSVPAKSTPTVEPDPEPAPPKRTRPEDLAPNGDKKGPPRNLPDRTKERVPVRPRVDTSQVAWADAKVVAGNALDVAHTFAVSDGRAPKRLAASVKDLVAPNVAERMVDLFGNGSPTPKGVSQKGQLLSANLQADPQTGARYAIVIIRRTFDGNPTEATLYLEFAPNRPIVTDFDYQPIISG